MLESEALGRGRFLAEYIGEREAKIGKDRAALQFAGSRNDTNLSDGFVHVDELLPGIDDPNDFYAGMEVFFYLLQELFRKIVRTYDFDCEIGNDSPRVVLSRYRSALGPAFEANKGSIGAPSPFSRRGKLEKHFRNGLADVFRAT